MSCLSQVCTSNGPHVIVGDFNLPHIDWINTIIPSDFKSQELFNWSCEFGLDQFILVPTRINHILDLIFYNDPFLISEVIFNEPFCSSHHDTVSFNIQYIETDVRDNVRANSFKLWNKADWQGFNQYCVNYQLTSYFKLFNCSSVDEHWIILADMLIHGINLVVPIQRKTFFQRLSKRLQAVKTYKDGYSQ